MDPITALRDFFDRRLNAADEAYRHLGLDVNVSRQHLIHHLVERTVRRASVDAASQRARGAGDANVPSTAEVSWKHCLMVAALTELRPLRLQTRGI